MKLAQLFQFPRRPDPAATEPVKPMPSLVVMRRPVTNPVTEAGKDLQRVGHEYAVQANILSEAEADRSHLQSMAFAQIDALYRPFEPASNDEDRQMVEDVATLRARRNELRDDVARLKAVREAAEREVPPPIGTHTISNVVIAAATAVFAGGFATSIKPLFENIEGMDDPIMAWGMAIAIGLAVGALITWSVLGIDEEEGQ